MLSAGNLRPSLFYFKSDSKQSCLCPVSMAQWRKSHINWIFKLNQVTPIMPVRRQRDDFCTSLPPAKKVSPLNPELFPTEEIITISLKCTSWPPTTHSHRCCIIRPTWKTRVQTQHSSPRLQTIQHPAVTWRKAFGVHCVIFAHTYLSHTHAHTHHLDGVV